MPPPAKPGTSFAEIFNIAKKPGQKGSQAQSSDDNVVALSLGWGNNGLN